MYIYSTLALAKEREIVKEETALRKEKEAVCCYAVQGCIIIYVYIGNRDGLEDHMHTYIYTGSRDGLEKHMHTQTDIKNKKLQ